MIFHRCQVIKKAKVLADIHTLQSTTSLYRFLFILDFKTRGQMISIVLKSVPRL